MRLLFPLRTFLTAGPSVIVQLLQAHSVCFPANYDTPSNCRFPSIRYTSTSSSAPDTPLASLTSHSQPGHMLPFSLALLLPPPPPRGLMSCLNVGVRVHVWPRAKLPRATLRAPWASCARPSGPLAGSASLVSSSSFPVLPPQRSKDTSLIYQLVLLYCLLILRHLYCTRVNYESANPLVCDFFRRRRRRRGRKVVFIIPSGSLVHETLHFFWWPWSNGCVREWRRDNKA